MRPVKNIPMDMNDNDLYERYASWSDERLFQVLLNHDEYTQNALQTAVLELKRRKLDAKVKELLEDKVHKENEARVEELRKAEIFTEVDLKYKLTFVPASTEQIMFERLLIENNIDYATNENNTLRGPNMDYLFSKENYNKAVDLSGKIEIPINSEEDPSQSTMQKLASRVNIIVLIVVALYLMFLALIKLYE
jgi:hypothetical protein